MPPIFEFALFVMGLSAVGSAVGVLVVLAGWWLFVWLKNWFADKDDRGPR
jgi:hypothetical protein